MYHFIINLNFNDRQIKTSSELILGERQLTRDAHQF